LVVVVVVVVVLVDRSIISGIKENASEEDIIHKDKSSGSGSCMLRKKWDNIILLINKL